MSDPTDTPPTKDSSIVEILDELISHMNRTRKIFMLLIASSFIIAPISLVMAGLLLAPPPILPASDFLFIAPDAPNLVYLNRSTMFYNSSMVSASEAGITITPADPHFNQGIIIKNIEPGFASFEKSVPQADMMISGKAVTHMMPVSGVQRFVIINDAPFQTNSPADITIIIMIFISVSVILAAIGLFIGIKEYGFFSRWNKKFSRYMALKNQIDKELEEKET
ncbi:MAG: hypothetical protein ACRD9Q_00790 [Nitrososphaeraceae archaeon]